MNDNEIVHFYSSEEIFDKAKNIFALQKEKIKKIIFFDADIQHVGSSSILGALGKFDVDIQIRVPSNIFKGVSLILKNYYDAKHPEIWTDEFMIFCDRENQQIDIMLTVIGSTKDDFYRVRDTLISNPKLLEDYNNLKRNFEGKKYSEYREAKKEFLGKNGNVKFLNYE